MGWIDTFASRIGFVRKPKTEPLYARAMRVGLVPGTPKRGTKLLRNFSENNEWVRGAINRRKHTLSQAHWQIVRTDDPKKPADPKIVKAFHDLFRYVNPTKMSSEELISQVVEDVLVVDAGCIEKERVAGGKVSALWPVDGASIAVNPRWMGEVNMPRYYQFDNDRVIANLLNDDLIYMKHNPRTYSPLGMSPVEALVRIIEAELYSEQYDTDLLRQTAPAGILDLGRGVPPKQVKEFREYYEGEIAGTKDLAIFGGGGDAGMSGEVKYTPFQANAKDMERAQYKKWLAGKIAFVFEMDLTAFNLTEDVNKAVGKVTSARTDEGLVSLATIIASFITREIVWEMDEDHGFVFTDLITRDEMAQAQIDAIYLDHGVTVPNEIRTREGEDEVAWGDKPFKMPVAGTPLDESGKQQVAPPAPAGGGGGDPAGAPGTPKPAEDEDNTPPKDGSKAIGPFARRSAALRPILRTRPAKYDSLANYLG